MRHGLFGSVNIWAGLQPHAWLGRLVSDVAQWEVDLLTKDWLEIRTKSHPPPRYDQHFKMAVPALKGFMLHYLQEKPLGGHESQGWTGPLLRRGQGAKSEWLFEEYAWWCWTVIYLSQPLCVWDRVLVGVEITLPGDLLHPNSTCWLLSNPSSPNKVLRDFLWIIATPGKLQYCFIFFILSEIKNKGQIATLDNFQS